MQIDFGRSYRICAVATQGDHPGSHSYLEEYKLRWSHDGVKWEESPEVEVDKLINKHFSRKQEEGRKSVEKVSFPWSVDYMYPTHSLSIHPVHKRFIGEFFYRLKNLI